jgi:hypothetical protein
MQHQLDCTHAMARGWQIANKSLDIKWRNVTIIYINKQKAGQVFCNDTVKTPTSSQQKLLKLFKRSFIQSVESIVSFM